jgi:GATA-binding protein
MKKSVIKRRKRVVPALRDPSPGAATESSTGSSASPEVSPAGLAQMADESRHYQGETDMNENRRRGSAGQRPLTLGPPPVDFTGYNSSAVSLPHHPPPPRLLEPDSHNTSHQSPGPQFGRQSSSPRSTPLGTTPGNSKKRAIGDTTGPADPATNLESNQLPPIMSQINPGPPARLNSISSLLNHTAAAEESRLDPSLAPYGRPSQPHSPSGPPRGSTDLDGYKLERRAQLQREAEEIREALRAKERELAELEP